MPINATIEDAVKDPLVLDPRISDPEQVVVSAGAGMVTLRGTVSSFRHRRAAGACAHAGL